MAKARSRGRGRTIQMANPLKAVARIVNGGKPRKRRAVHRRLNGSTAIAKRAFPAAKAAYAMKANKSPKRRVAHYKKRHNPGTFAGAGDILRQLGYGGLGAFLVSTATQLVPFNLSSPIMVLLLQLGLSIGVGWLGKKVFGPSQGQIMRIGAFAFTAGNAVQNFLPSLQSTIVSLSPIKAAPRAALPVASGAGAAVPGTNGVELVSGLDNVVSDIEQVYPGQFGYAGGYGYMGDVYEVQPGAFGY